MRTTKKEIRELIVQYEINKGLLLEKLNTLLNFSVRWEKGLNKLVEGQMAIDKLALMQLHNSKRKRKFASSPLLKKAVKFKKDISAFEVEITSFHKQLIYVMDKYEQEAPSLKRNQSQKKFNLIKDFVDSHFPGFHEVAEELLFKCIKFNSRFDGIIKKVEKYKLKVA